jgi:hypothetical protein
MREKLNEGGSKVAVLRSSFNRIDKMLHKKKMDVLFKIESESNRDQLNMA